MNWISSLILLGSTPVGRSFISHGGMYHNRLNKNPFQRRSERVLIDSTSAAGIRLTCLLLIVSFIFVLCTLPISIRSLTADFFPKHGSTARGQTIQLSLTVLMYLNHAVMTFSGLYC